MLSLMEMVSFGIVQEPHRNQVTFVANLLDQESVEVAEAIPTKNCQHAQLKHDVRDV